MKKYLKFYFKIIAWFVGVVVGILLILIVLIQVPAVQKFAKNKVVSFLENKIKTKVEIGKIEIGLPKKIILKDFYFQDQLKDTLLAGKKLAVDISLFKLLDNKVEINSIDLQQITTTIKRNQDSVFNFDYIIKAFASTKTPKPIDTTAAMQFSITKINLDNLKIKFNDALTKNDLDIYLYHFDTNIKKFDLDKMDFEIPKITLDGLNLKLEQGLVEEIATNTVILADSITKKPELFLKLGEIELSKINVTYGNSRSQLKTDLALGKMFIAFNAINLKNQLIDIKKLEWFDTKGSLFLDKKVKEIVAKNAKPAPASVNKWKVKLAEANFEKIDFNFDNQNSIRIKRGIDYQHLSLKNFALKARSFYYSADTISGILKNLTAKEKSGLSIETLKTYFFYSNNSAFLKNLYLKTPHTVLQNRIELKYKSISSLSKNLGKLYVNANINGSIIGEKDLLLFVPTLANISPFKANPNISLFINSRVIGEINNLNIPELQISGIGGTKISASGKIKGLPNVEKAYFELNINNLESTASDLNLFLPKGTLPTNIRIPERFAVRGKFKGAINNFNTNLIALTSYGIAKIKAVFDQRIKNSEKYKADVVLTNFNLGRLLKQEAKLGKISLIAKVNGTGLNPKTASATLKGIIQKAEYNKYTYRNLNLAGKINKRVYNVLAFMNDPNLDFDLKANGSFAGKYPSVKMKLNLDSANLGKLNLYPSNLRICGKVDADIASVNPDYLNGKISLNHILIAKTGERLLLDSINIISTATNSKNTFELKSPFLYASLNGKYKLTQIGNALTNSILRYYNINQTTFKKQLVAQNFSLKVNIYNTPSLFKLVPSIKKLETIQINGRYNSIGDSLILHANIPKLVYGNNTITGAKLDINTADKALVYNLLIDEIKNSQILLPYTSLNGTLQNNLLDYKLLVKDKLDKDRYFIAGNLKTTMTATEIRLAADGLKLNYQPWIIANNNFISLGKNGIFANNFLLSNQSQSIKIQSQNRSENSPLTLNFNNFKIETITSIVEKDSLLVGGLINGNALVSNINTSPKFTSNLTINDFNFKADTLGNIALKINNITANTLAANVTITGKGNQVNLEGIYNTNERIFNVNLNLQKLHLKTIQGFTMGNLTESSGYLSGIFKITGNTTKPNVRGDLQFNNGAFRVKPLNSYFKLLNDKITFNYDGILFNKFSLDDSANNKMVVNGLVYTQTFRDYRFNLEVDANNFRAINSTEKDNSLYYGQLFLNTHLRIKGDIKKPIIDGTMAVNKDTKFTVVLPQSDPAIADREGIVEFIDQDKMQLAQIFSLPDSLNKSDIKGMDVSLNIDIDKEAQLSLVLDKGNGDFVKLKGEARLNGGIDQSGKVSLTGRYDLKEGSYEMSFNFIKRKFLIKDGGSIVWTGEPTSAIIDITAVYVANTAPIDLLDNQLTGLSPQVRNTYKQKLPFKVFLNMKGELLLPVITFDVVLPDGNYNVSSDIINNSKIKLEQLRQQPSELNKQVFALLLLNRFIGENPFASEAGGGG